MKPFNNLVHYIWVGPNNIPFEYLENFESSKTKNPTYSFYIWNDTSIKSILPEQYLAKYDTMSIFHKLQMGRYHVANLHGGIVCDFDIIWKETFDYMYEWFDGETDMIFPYRRSLHFYDMGKKTTLVDDFFFACKPALLSKFLDFCEENKHILPQAKETPYSVWNLTVWLLNQPNVKYLSAKHISEEEDSVLAVHANKKTWS